MSSGSELASCPSVHQVQSGVLDREPRNVTGMVVSPLPLVRDMVDSTTGQRVASQQTPQGQQRALDRTMHLQRGDGIGRARGVVTAGGRQGRRDEVCPNLLQRCSGPGSAANERIRINFNS